MSLLTAISNPFVVTAPDQGPEDRTPLVIVPGKRRLEVWFNAEPIPVDSSFFTPTNYAVSIEGEAFFPELVSQGEAPECIILIFSQDLPAGDGYLTIWPGIMEFPDGGVNSDEPFAFHVYGFSESPAGDCFCVQKIEFKQQELHLDILDKSDGELEFQQTPLLMIQQNNFLIKIQKFEN